MFQLDVVSNKLNFVFLTKDPLPEIILADQKRLRQIYLNILANAFKYTPSGSIKVTVSFKQNFLKFRVEDTGVGISTEDYLFPLIELNLKGSEMISWVLDLDYLFQNFSLKG